MSAVVEDLRLFETQPGQLHQLRLVTLYLSERCNSRCVTCDYWRYGREDMSLQSVRRLLPGLLELGIEQVLISGGEPLLNPEWPQIAQLLRAAGLKLWLLTSGLSLAKHAHRVARLFDAATVSLDGTTSQTYTAIRGLDAFAKVCEGISAVANAGLKAGIRVTIQRANYRQLPAFVDLAHQLDAREISFLAVDVANPHAFARTHGFVSELALLPGDLPVLDRLLRSLEQSHAEDFHTSFIAESPGKLRRIHGYFSALCGAGDFPPVRCNAPEFSVVIDAKSAVHPCFFIPGPRDASARDDLKAVLSGHGMRELRATIRAGERRECSACVCPMWRER